MFVNGMRKEMKINYSKEFFIGKYYIKENFISKEN
jgi:hypothetical protein